MKIENFFSELKRRNVYKVAVAYAVVGWLLVQITTQVFPIFEIPNWALRLIVFAIVIGFPIALVIAWAFELTPQGLKRTEDVDPSAEAKAPKKHAWIYVVVIGAAISLGLFFIGRYTARNTPAPGSTGPAAKSIAVLPFVNMSADKNDEYLSDGVSEELISALSKIPGLQVKARTSCFAFKGKNEDIQKISEVLHVSHLVEGSVAKAGNKLRITAQLIQASDGNHLWSDTYDRETQDIFAVRSDVARQVVQALQVKLGVQGSQALAASPTQSLKAFQYYMQGRTARQRRTSADLATAIRAYEQALKEDPNYAWAYAGLADAYASAGYYGAMAPAEGRRKSEEAARKALAIDPNLAEAHAALGLTYVGFSPSNFSLGEKELRRAMELSPSLAEAPYNLGIGFVRQGRLDEALAELKKARELDPMSSIMARAVALPHYFKRDYARASELLKTSNKLGPALSATWEIGLYLKSGSLKEAFTEIEKAKATRKDDPLLIYSAGVAYAGAGKKPEALESIKELETMSGPGLSTAHWIAKIYATLNDKEMAFSWLERAWATGAIGVFYKDEPIWDPIRDDPRFGSLAAKILAPEPAEKL